ncbi:MAG: hypothetical protein Q9165_004368 [Trypethelium subeluteriae]
MPDQITQEHIEFFKEHGYLVVKDVLSPPELKDLQLWAQEVHDWPITPDVPYMPYEEVNAQGKRVLCRTENFTNYHSGFNELLRGQKLLGVLSRLAGEDMLLFKEKINYKLSGSGGFSPHIDSTSFAHVQDVEHLTILLAVDPSNMSNGGLEVVDKSHRLQVPVGSDNCIEPKWVQAQTWTPVELEPGQLLVFGSYLAHRSGPNRSDVDRKAIYATYNGAREGDLHDQYYADRQNFWPATHVRKPGEDYAEGALRYGFGSPMLSVDLGKQLQV